MWVTKYSFVSEDVNEHEQIEMLHKRRNMLASFCKLLVYNVIRIKAAAEIFQHYVKVRIIAFGE